RSAGKADRPGLRVLVGLELSRSAEHVLRRILQRSWPAGTELRVMTGDDSTSRQWQSDGVFRDIFVGDLRVSAVTVKGDTQEVLLDAARRMEADCLVIGSGLAAIAANADCSVEIIR
ncbi:MAG TPA: hypothetical protein VN844_21275, partial [Pyrinomonadaceae bacterium]|nr:hypothetical protein [Pyrinomonadaceae bacterium]